VRVYKTYNAFVDMSSSQMVKWQCGFHTRWNI